MAGLSAHKVPRVPAAHKVRKGRRAPKVRRVLMLQPRADLDRLRHAETLPNATSNEEQRASPAPPGRRSSVTRVHRRPSPHSWQTRPPTAPTPPHRPHSSDERLLDAPARPAPPPPHPRGYSVAGAPGRRRSSTRTIHKTTHPKEPP